MKFLRLFLITSLVLISVNAKAYQGPFPPITNIEVKSYADFLIQNNMPNRAKKFYTELKKRGDTANYIWGMALVDIKVQNNLSALKKINFLLTKEKLQERKLKSIKAELLINLAEDAIFKNQKVQAQNFLKEYYNVAAYYKKDTLLQERSLKLENILNNRNFNQRRVNIGVILPLTGKLAPLGKEIQKSLIFTIYDKKFNNINLFFEDNHSSQEGSITAATQVINNAPNLIIGPILRDNVLAANTVIENTQIPLFALSNDSSIAGNNIFLNNVNLKQETSEISNFAFDIHKFTLSCLVPNTEYGKEQKEAFIQNINNLNGSLYKCINFNNSKIDIKSSLKQLLDIDKLEKKRKKELKSLEKEFDSLGNAMDDDKIKRLEELKESKLEYDINFDGIFVPTTPQRMLVIAPQLAFYDVDFSSGVLFLGTSSWDNKTILKNSGEHLHFSRFLSLKTTSFKKFEKDFIKRYNHKLGIMSGFANDILYLSQNLDLSQNIYKQLYRTYGFNVLTGNVRFLRNNMPERMYGINKISRKKIKVVKTAKHQRPVSLPRDLSIKKQSVFNNWFKF